MAIEDLDLEFEDENEQGASEALDVDLDLTFGADADTSPKGGGVRVRPVPKKNPSKSVNVPDNVSPINQARNSSSKPQPKSSQSSEIEMLMREIQFLKDQMNEIQRSADVKLAVAEAEKDYLIEYVSNAKVLDHQVTQVLQRIHQKVPALKGEVQAIKKHVQEFVRKSIPKKKGES